MKLDGEIATVLCLVGTTGKNSAGGASRAVWTGSHVRDTWIKTAEGWRRRRHEKLTVNETTIDGRPAPR